MEKATKSAPSPGLRPGWLLALLAVGGGVSAVLLLAVLRNVPVAVRLLLVVFDGLTLALVGWVLLRPRDARPD